MTKGSAKQKRTAITPTRSEDFPQWYQEAVRVADLAEHSSVRGCMIIKPWGYSIWENIQQRYNVVFKKHGVKNAYFPLFIPLSQLQKEAEHVEGFAPECAIVTHTRLESKDGTLIPSPDAELAEPLIVRPTSEMIIGESFSKWIESHRDLPLKINQWANIVRWEMRTRLFLRTAEILWQEGHAAFATEDEAVHMAKTMLQEYARFAADYMAIPAICGKKSPNETFPGAETTYTYEALMQDGKALQMGTSHYMGTNFAKAQSIDFLNEEGERTLAHTISWGLTTRIIGAMIMVHGDDNGIIIPPRIASTHVQIIPVIHKEEDAKEILQYCHRLREMLQQGQYHEHAIGVEIDARDLRSGERSWDAIKKGVPLRIEIGKREVEANALTLYVRNKEKADGISTTPDDLVPQVVSALDMLQKELLEKAKDFQKSHTTHVETLVEFQEKAKDPQGGFIVAPWKGDRALEEKLKAECGVTIRCIPQGQPSQKKCLFTQADGAMDAYFATSY